MLHTMFLCVTASPPPPPVRHSEGMELRLGRERPSYSRSFLSMLLSRDPAWGGPESCLSPQVTPLGCGFTLSLRVLLRCDGRDNSLLRGSSLQPWGLTCFLFV